MMKKYGMTFFYGTIPVALVWRKPFIVEYICLDGIIPEDAEPVENDPEALDFVRRLQYFSPDGHDAAKPEEFDLSLLTDFQRKILQTLRKQVPRGQVTTYGKLAEMAGYPGAAQAVGQVMRRNPLPLAFPCHRVLGANHAPGGFQGGLEMKSRLLQQEGSLPD